MASLRAGDDGGRGAGEIWQAAVAAAPMERAAAASVGNAIGECIRRGSSGSPAPPIKPRRASTDVAQLPQLVLPVGGQLRRRQPRLRRVAVLVAPPPREAG